MAKVSEALRKRLQEQKKGMDKGGMLIANKGFTVKTLRILPIREGELPGQQYTSFYAKGLSSTKKGTTCPISFGVPCPVNDFLSKLYLQGSQEDKDFASEFVRRSSEYWMAVIDREDEGTPDQPNLRVLRGKQTVYQQIINWMIDEDLGSEDITDPVDGRDLLIKKTGSGLDTEWLADKKDKSPISAKPAMRKAWIDLSKSFDVRSKFFAVDLEVLSAIYEGLTGEPIPDHYMPALEDLVKTGWKPDAIVETDELEEEEEGEELEEEEEGEELEEEEEGEELEEEEDVEEEVVEEDELIGKPVMFEDDSGEQVEGVVVSLDEDEEDGEHYVVRVGSDDWSLDKSELTVVEPKPAKPSRPKAKTLKKTVKSSTPSKPATTGKVPRKPKGASAASRIKSSLKK